MKPGQILYARQGGQHVLRLVGDVRQNAMGGYHSAAELAAFIAGLLGQGEVGPLIVDLAELEYIDSTHLGLLAQIAVGMQAKGEAPPVIAAPNERISRVLHEMCLDRLFTFCDSSSSSVPPGQPLPEHRADETEGARVVIEAHRALAALSRENATRFQDVIALLEEQAKPEGEETAK